MTALLLVACALAVVAVTGLAVLALLRGRRRAAGRRLAAVAGIVAGYLAVLVAVAWASRPDTLPPGAWKCFDDWCVTLLSSTVPSAVPSTVPAGVTPAGPGAPAARRSLVIEIRNGARRQAMRPDDPHAYLVTAATRVEVDVPGLGQRLEPGQTAVLRVTVALTAPAERTAFLVTEGGFPSRITVGDENSPGHATSTWSV